MKNCSKKMFSVLLAVIVLIGAFAVTAFAVGETITLTDDPLTYMVSGDDTVTVIACASGQTHITIPSEIQSEGKSYRVTAILSGLFNRYDTLETLTFADGCKIETLTRAFNNCVNLRTINWGKNSALREITKSFRSCTSLQTLTIPNTLVTIGDQSFANCVSLNSLTFEQNSQLTFIGKKAFAYTGKHPATVPATISRLTLPASLVTLEEDAFLRIPVQHFALEDNSHLTAIPEGFLEAKAVGSNGYPGQQADYSQHPTVYSFFRDEVQLAGNCLKTIDFGENNSLASIGSGAFKNQSHLSSIDFGTSTAALTIHGGAFIGVGNNGYLYENGIDTALHRGIDTLEFPTNLSVLEAGAFDYARIKNLAFRNGCRLESIPNSFLGVTGAGYNGHPGLNNGAFIHDEAQLAANSLETIDFGDNNHLKTISTGAFYNQSHLKSIDFGTENVNDLTIAGSAFTGVGNNGYLYANKADTALNEGIALLEFPSNLTKMESSFLYANIQNIVFSEGCRLKDIPATFMGVMQAGSNGYPGRQGGTFVHDEAQLAANRLETIDFGDNNHLETIGSGAFYNQSHMKSIDFGTAADGITLTIHSGAFIGVGNNGYLYEENEDSALNEGIETLEFPTNLSVLGPGAFEYARIKNLAFRDGCQLESIPTNFLGIFGRGCNGYPGLNNGAFIRDEAQLAANNLETIDFGDNNHLKTIDSGAFYNQSHMKAINFGTAADGVTLTINTGAFIGVGNNGYLYEENEDSALNEGIETLTFPSHLTNLHEGAFDYARVKNLVFSKDSKLARIPSNFMSIVGAGSNGYPGRQGGTFVHDEAQLAANSLETIDFGDNNSLTEISVSAFRNQSHITSIDFGTPASTVAKLEIGAAAFVGVGNNDYLAENVPGEALSEGIELLDLSKTKIQTLSLSNFSFSGIKKVILPDTLTTLDSGAFQVLPKLETLTIGSDCPLTTLEGGVFSDCEALESVNLLKSNITVINDALKNNPNLTHIVFPEKLEQVTWREETCSHEACGAKCDEVCSFYGCDQVNKLRFAATNPSGYTFTDNVFQFLNEAGIVYVPAETTDAEVQAYEEKLTEAGLVFGPDNWVIRPVDHDLKLVAAVDATCEKYGNGAHYACSICLGSFADADAAIEIEETDWFIPALGHAYGEWTVVDETTHQRICGNDASHIEVRNHIFRSGSCMFCDYTQSEAPDDSTPDWLIPGIIDAVASAAGGFPFDDVKRTDWFYDEVKDAWENDLIDGVTKDSFLPEKELTVAQAIKLAAALHQKGYYGYVTLENGYPNWYSSYVDYAVNMGIIDSKYQSYNLSQMNAPISREEFVSIFYGAMPESSYTAWNEVADNAIPDVKMGDAYAEEIYTFYRAGILTGSDAKGTFHPESSIKRSEVAAILIRMYDTTARQSVTLK